MRAMGKREGGSWWSVATRVLAVVVTVTMVGWGGGAVVPGAAGAQGGGLGAMANVRVSALAERKAVTPGDQFAVAVVFDHAKHWHIQTNDPKVPKEFEDLKPIATTIEASAGEGVEVGPVQWPKPEVVEVGFFGAPVKMEVFGGRAVAFVPVRVAPTFKGVSLKIELMVGYQACDDRVCAPPEDVSLAVEVAVLPLEQAAAQAGEVGADFAAFDRTVFAKMLAGTVDGGAVGTASFDFLGYKFDLARNAYVVILLIALVAGFLLNLTPCVLPVIPLKVLSLQQQAGNRGKLLLYGLVYCAGIVATFLVLGLLIFGVLTGGQKQDWGQIFTSAWFTIAMAVIVGAMGLGMMGLFTVTLPAAVYGLSPKHDSMTGNFLMGVLTAVLSTPCTGPFLGATIAWAATQPRWIGLAAFLVMGIGMALPYAVLIGFPRLIDRLPRGGPGGELLKQVLGILLIGVAAFLASNLTGEKWPWYGIGAIAVAGGIWAIGGAWRMLRTRKGKVIVTVLAVGWIALSVVTTRALTDEGPIGWTRFVNEPEAKIRRRIAEDMAMGRTVVVDFTAKWCTNCHVIERTVLYSETGLKVLTGEKVTPLKVDLTSADQDEGWGLVREISGGGGIPLIAIYRPGAEKPVYFNSFFKPSDLEAAVNGQ